MILQTLKVRLPPVGPGVYRVPSGPEELKYALPRNPKFDSSGPCSCGCLSGPRGIVNQFTRQVPGAGAGGPGSTWQHTPSAPRSGQRVWTSSYFPFASEEKHVLWIIATAQGDAEVVAEYLFEPRSREHPASQAPVLSWSLRYERLVMDWTSSCGTVRGLEEPQHLPGQATRTHHRPRAAAVAGAPLRPSSSLSTRPPRAQPPPPPPRNEYRCIHRSLTGQNVLRETNFVRT